MATSVRTLRLLVRGCSDNHRILTNDNEITNIGQVNEILDTITDDSIIVDTDETGIIDIKKLRGELESGSKRETETEQ